MKLVLATRNRKKAEELERILREIGNIGILTLEDFPNCPEVIEDGKTFEENALKKARVVSEYTGLPALADDSGLEVDVLNGAPGVFSARYAGDNATDEDNVRKLLEALKGVSDEKRTARFVCCIALVLPQGVQKTFVGYVYGKIAKSPKGKRGFGYDPVFYPDFSSLTFAEMDPSEKDRISHRKQALLKLREYIAQLRSF
ncbi:MAG: XTP/dITP diphosphatase [Thermodesulfovibrionales bacterium]|nr:XTP/dITP diphosphatase [Thermodesulfovibrionales bacterium]